ncbi:MAG TPA: hypothetical protein VMM76_27380 [Pirellulaceae bacterium]|nr:hypothetical protein [Pirellulaceae bacterium]
MEEQVLNQGKLVIAFIFGLSAVMGGYAWWHHYTQGRRCVEFWGAEAGEMIRYAPQVEVIRLAPPEVDGAETIQIQDESLAISARREITDNPGLVHARQALIEDASFLWNADLEGPPNWEYLLRFTDGDQQVSVAIDCDRGRVQRVGSDRSATLKPHLATAYQTRLPMWLGSDVKSSQPAEAATADTP